VAVPVRVKATPAGAEWLLEPGAALPAVSPAGNATSLHPGPSPNPSGRQARRKTRPADTGKARRQPPPQPAPTPEAAE
jgi:hypothetical protein